MFNPLSLFISPQDVLLSCALERGKSKGEELQSPGKNVGGNVNMKGNYTKDKDGGDKAASPRKKVVKTGSERTPVRRRSDASCTKLGGICQPTRYICQGRYLKDKCIGARSRQCCVPGKWTFKGLCITLSQTLEFWNVNATVSSVVGAWSILCAGHHNNRVRACDAHGCGAFNSKR